MVDYNNLQNVAYKLLNNFGADWIHRVNTKGAYNPSTGIRNISTTVNTTVKAARINYKNNQIDGQQIQNGDIRLIVEHKNINTTPTIHDKMVNGSEIWNIINIKEVKPATTAIYYDMQLRI